MRILALDWGEVRVGAAVSDPSGQIAFPLDKIIESKNAITEIKQLVDELEIVLVLIGMPKNLKGESGISSEKLKKFAASLSQIIKTPIEFIDERFTSVEAGNRLSEQGLNLQQQRTIKDNIAAQIILQQYLNTQVNK